MTTDPLLHFVVRNLTFTPSDFGVDVVCYTNNPCHLWMRWTDIEPQKHVHVREVRGAPAGTFIDQCFVAFHDLEQAEPGDTYIHTFHAQPWPTCQTRWLYFRGQVSTIDSPSASAIFQYHRTGPQLTTDYCLTFDANQFDAQPWNCLAQLITPIETYSPTLLKFILAQRYTDRYGNFTIMITLAGGNCWEEPILWQAVGDSRNLPISPDTTPTTWPISGLTLNTGTKYHIVPLCLPPWYKWDGTKWVQSDASAILDSYRQTANPPYTRGGMTGGCNFRDGAGAFPDSYGQDFYFALYK